MGLLLLIAIATGMIAVAVLQAPGPKQSPSTGSVPNIVGLEPAAARAAAERAGFQLIVHADDAEGAVLYQTPPAGAQYATVRILRATIRDPTTKRTLAPQIAARALEAAREALNARGGSGVPVQLEPVGEVLKGHPCPLDTCVIVRLNTVTQGIAVGVDTASAEPALDVAWQVKPYPPLRIMSDQEAIEAATAALDVAVALRGRPFSAAVASGGDGPHCTWSDGTNVCLTVAIFPRPGGEQILAAVNYVTTEAGRAVVP